MWTIADLGLDQPCSPHERARLIESLAMSLSPMHPRLYDRLKGEWDKAQKEILEGLEASVEAAPEGCGHQWKYQRRRHPYVPEREEDRIGCTKCGDALVPWRMIRKTKESV